MPEHEHYFYINTSYNSFDYMTASNSSQEQQQYEEYVQECKRQEQEWERAYAEEMLRLEEERLEEERIKEDKWRHPLFYLKEGIV